MSTPRPLPLDDVPANVAVAWEFAAGLDPEHRDDKPWDPNDPSYVSYAEYLCSPELQEGEWRVHLWRHYQLICQIIGYRHAARTAAARWAEWADSLARHAAARPVSVQGNDVGPMDIDLTTPARVDLAPGPHTLPGLGRRLDQVLADADAIAARHRRHADSFIIVLTKRLDELTAVYEEGPYEEGLDGDRPHEGDSGDGVPVAPIAGSSS